MSRLHSHVNTAVSILRQYKGELPFPSFLKNYFSADKKYGSRDRKSISHLCYCYFRLGKAWQNMPADKRIILALFMCSDRPNEYITEFRPLWLTHITLSASEKAARMNFITSDADTLRPELIFPWTGELSEGMDREDFVFSHFRQPGLFIRIRPGFENEVLGKLKNHNVEYEIVKGACVRLPNGTKLERMIEIDKEAVIQDFNSQQTMYLLKSKIENRNSKINVWDCCAGSGGKSIQACDLLPGIQLTVSDIRESIISNLKTRFERASIKNYNSLISDLTKTNTFPFRPSTFDLVIADLPCTGSGTWSRTPEQLYFFDPEKIDSYSEKQEKILTNIIPAIKPGGYLLFITCSVFRKENEEQVEKLHRRGMKEITRELFRGYGQGADTLFAALLQKPIA